MPITQTYALRTSAGSSAQKVNAVAQAYKNLRERLEKTKESNKKAKRANDETNKSLDKTSKLARRAGAALGAYLSARLIARAGQLGDQLKRSREQFEILLQGKADPDSFLSQLRDASGGLLTDLELISSSIKGLDLGLNPQDIETITRASRTLAARRPELSTAQAFDQLVTTATRRTLALVDNIGLAPEKFKQATSEADKLRLIMEQINTLAEASPADNAITRFQVHVRTFQSLLQRTAAAVIDSPAASELIGKLDDLLDPDRVRAWGDAIEDALSNLTLRDVFQTMELEAAQFLQSKTGRILVAVMSGFLGLRVGQAAGGFTSSLLGRVPNVGRARVGLLGLAAGLLTGSLGGDLDLLHKRLDNLDEDLRSNGFLDPRAIAEGTLTRLLEVLTQRSVQTHPQLTRTLERAVNISRELDASLKRDRQNRFVVDPVSVSGSVPVPGSQGGAGLFWGTLAQMLAGQSPNGNSIFFKHLTPLLGQPRGPGELRGVLGSAAGSLARSFADLELNANRAGLQLASIAGGAGSQRIASLAAGTAKGSLLKNLGIGFGLLGAGFVLNSLLGGEEQREQTRHLEAIRRNTGEQRDLLEQAIGTPSGFVSSNVGVLSYDGLGAAAAADLGR